MNLNLSKEERTAGGGSASLSHLKQLILDQQLTESLDFLRGCARRQFLSHRTRITEEMLVKYLATWQRILSVSEADNREPQLAKTTDKTQGLSKIE